MSNRRTFLQSLSNVPLLGGLLATRTAPAAVKDVFQDLGVRPIINAAGAYTMFTGSLMRPEVVKAIDAASRKFVRLDELHDAVGKRIASLLGVEAAMVPSGAAAGLTLGTAACITGTNAEFIQRIPDTTGMKNEVVIQKTHRFPYDHMVRNCGVRLIEVETAEELERAIGPRTAMLLYLNKSDHLGKVGMEEFLAIAKKRSIPTMNDAAADVPPLENLTRPIRAGFDLLVVSGGKAIRGPQSAGLLFGRADLIKAARMNTIPNSDTMGRSCKVNKEEMVGMMVALESFLKEDHAANTREWERRVKSMAEILSKAPGSRTEPFVPRIANQVPHLRLHWDESKLSPSALMQKLREGDPSIELVPQSSAGGVEIAVSMLAPGEAEIVARRIVQILGA